MTITATAMPTGVACHGKVREERRCSNHAIARGLAEMTPPSTVPRIMASTVVPSIQPLAATSRRGGSTSARMPYLAGEYADAPSPTMP
jgi:hypothetical protein